MPVLNRNNHRTPVCSDSANFKSMAMMLGSQENKQKRPLDSKNFKSSYQFKKLILTKREIFMSANVFD